MFLIHPSMVRIENKELILTDCLELILVEALEVCINLSVTSLNSLIILTSFNKPYRYFKLKRNFVRNFGGSARYVKIKK